MDQFWVAAAAAAREVGELGAERAASSRPADPREAQWYAAVQDDSHAEQHEWQDWEEEQDLEQFCEELNSWTMHQQQFDLQAAEQQRQAQWQAAELKRQAQWQAAELQRQAQWQVSELQRQAAEQLQQQQDWSPWRAASSSSCRQRSRTPPAAPPRPPPPAHADAWVSSRAERNRPRGGKKRDWYAVYRAARSGGASDEDASSAANIAFPEHARYY